MKKFAISAAFIITLTMSYAQQSVDYKDLNPTLFNLDFKRYDKATATFCAEVSDLVYANEQHINLVMDTLNKLYPEARIKSLCIKGADNTQVLLLGTKDFVLISFRGTVFTKLKDLVSDVKFWVYENTHEENETLANMPPGHGGFRKRVMNLIQDEKIFEKLKDFIKSCNDSIDPAKFPIYLTGHSLGSGIAQMFVEPLVYRNFNFRGLYNFAPPLAVSFTAIEEMRTKYQSVTYDIVNFKDYVPRAGRLGVAHFGKFYRICEDGEIYREDEYYFKFRFLEWTKEYKYHSIANHVKALKNSVNTLNEINKRSTTACSCMCE